MIYLKTMLKVIDNSGAQMVECIKVLRKNPKNHASIGDKIVCVVQKAKALSSPFASASANKVKRGDIVRALVVRTKKELRRPDGSTIRFDDNACVLLNKNDQPIGNRIMGVVAKEIRGKEFGKILSLAPKAV